MVDVVQTAANVVPVSNVKYHDGTGGATIVAGSPCYADPADGNQLKACDATSATKANCKGILVHPAADNQPARLVTEGTINVGAVLQKGRWYCVSATVSGKIAPVADLVTGNFSTLLGYGDATGNLVLDIKPTGESLP